jgi:hypothetical protein
MRDSWIKVADLDMKLVLDGTMPIGEFEENLSDRGRWIVVDAEFRWYVGLRDEFAAIIRADGQAALAADPLMPVAEWLAQMGARYAAHTSNLAAPSAVDLAIADHIGTPYDRAISRGEFGTLTLWERRGESSNPSLMDDRSPQRVTVTRSEKRPGMRPPREWSADYHFDLIRMPRHVGVGAGDGDEAPHVGADAFELPDDGSFEAASPMPEPMPEEAASPGVLAAEAAAPAFPDLVIDEEPPGGRWINAILEDHDADEPLEFGEVYTLAISIDRDESVDEGAVGGAKAAPLLRDPASDITVTVSLSSTEFEIPQAQWPLKITKDGLSKGKVRFQIEPKITRGVGRLTAVIHRDNNFVQQLDIVLQIGEKTEEGTSVNSLGRPVEAARTLSRRDMGLSIQPSAGGGFDCMMWGVAASMAHLPISAAELAQGIDDLRAAVFSVIDAKNSQGGSPFLTGVVIPPNASAAGLKVMAEAGYRLFQSLFFHPASDLQCKAMGNSLIKKITGAGEGFTLQVVARDFPVPWSLLYVTPKWDPNNIQWERFVGASLVVEQIPLCNDSNQGDTRIPGKPDGLKVSLNFNGDIDKNFNCTVIADQQAYWSNICKTSPGVSAVTHMNSSSFISALSNPAVADQIIYFYCHAESQGLGAPGGPGLSRLVYSTQDTVTLNQLNLNAPLQDRLTGAPLVFINACESGLLSPLFYNGFVPYFLGKGARGVIGTECKVPALFAEAWAERFFEEFLRGAALGETVHKLRNEFFNTHKNPLGLLYGVHCNADTQIDPLP